MLRNGTDPGGTKVDSAGLVATEDDDGVMFISVGVMVDTSGIGAPIGVGGGLKMAVGVLSTTGA